MQSFWILLLKHRVAGAPRSWNRSANFATSPLLAPRSSGADKNLGVPPQQSVVGNLECIASSKKDPFVKYDLKQNAEYLIQQGLPAKFVDSWLTKCALKRSSGASIQQLDDIIRFLRVLDLDDDMIGLVASRFPPFLFRSVEGTLVSRFEFLKSLGMDHKDIGRLVIRSPTFMCLTVELLKKRLEFLKGIFLEDKVVLMAVSKFPSLLILCLERSLKPKLAFFEGLGLTGNDFRRVLMHHPSILSLKVNNISKKIIVFEKLGLVKGSRGFSRAVAALLTMSEKTLEARFNNLTVAGLSRDQALKIVSLYPDILKIKDQVLRDRLHYVVNVMNRPVEELITHNRILTYDFEKRIKPRYEAWIHLRAKGLTKEKVPLTYLYAITNERFQKKFGVALSTFGGTPLEKH